MIVFHKVMDRMRCSKRRLFQMSVKPSISLFFKKLGEAVSTSVFLKQDSLNIRTAVL